MFLSLNPYKMVGSVNIKSLQRPTTSPWLDIARPQSSRQHLHTRTFRLICRTVLFHTPHVSTVSAHASNRMRTYQIIMLRNITRTVGPQSRAHAHAGSHINLKFTHELHFTRERPLG